MCIFYIIRLIYDKYLVCINMLPANLRLFTLVHNCLSPIFAKILQLWNSAANISDSTGYCSSSRRVASFWPLSSNSNTSPSFCRSWAPFLSRPWTLFNRPVGDRPACHLAGHLFIERIISFLYTTNATLPGGICLVAIKMPRDWIRGALTAGQRKVITYINNRYR
jgi:hypothetical protein